MQEPEKSTEVYPSELKERRSLTKRYPYVLNITLGASCALLMFQLYLIAPLIPGYTREFNSSLMGMAIPAFAIPFALAAAGMILFPSSTKNPDKWFSVSLIAMCAGSLLLSIVGSAEAFILNRVLTGLGTGAMLPSALIIATRSVDKSTSFSNMIVIIFFLATGMTFAPSTGGWLNGPWGWRFLYQVIGIAAGMLWLSHLVFNKKNQEELYRHRHKVNAAPSLQIIWKGRGIYFFVYLSGVFHSGVFVWIIHYFSVQYGLNEYELANALLIFGLPGLTITMLMFRYRLDTKVISILYFGLILTMAGLFIMMINVPLWLAECLLAIMSVGYCFSQPLFIGIVKIPFGGLSAGRLIAIGSGILFAGYGTGPLIMVALLDAGRIASMVFLVLLVIIMAVFSRRIWRISEFHHRHHILHRTAG